VATTKYNQYSCLKFWYYALAHYSLWINLFKTLIRKWKQFSNTPRRKHHYSCAESSTKWNWYSVLSTQPQVDPYPLQRINRYREWWILNYREIFKIKIDINLKTNRRTLQTTAIQSQALPFFHVSTPHSHIYYFLVSSYLLHFPLSHILLFI
jgi:hypothetical protein